MGRGVKKHVFIWFKFVVYDVKKHVESLQHKEAKRFETKSLLSAEAYQENVVMNSSIAKKFFVSIKWRPGRVSY